VWVEEDGMTFTRWMLAAACGLPAAAPAAQLHLDRIRLPPGFHIETYAAGVINAREMCLSPSGTLFVSTRREGNVYALQDTKKQGKADRVVTIAQGLQNPNGVAFREGALYVAERSRVLRYDDIERHLDHPPPPVVIRDDFPKEAHHGWKFIAFGPDGWLYVPVGAPCNVCKSSDEIFATITRLSPDGKRREIYARGVRNTVGFDWHPQTRALWFTDNGRDEMGDQTPPDELNRAERAGLDFGFPACHGTGIADPELGRGKDCAQTVAPAADLRPHIAALGMRFYTGSMFPPGYRGSIFIAEHGSWNRSIPSGYDVLRVRLEGDKVVSQEVFASGWLPPDPGPEDPHLSYTLRADESADRSNRGGKRLQAWGRPVDVLVMPDGALLVSDDTADAIYRISYRAP
jgi:glucose/arabinose dehydrogenase